MTVREPMPSIEMINWEGLYTKQNPETLQVTQLRECKNADFFREYGSLSKIRGTKRILNTQYFEGGECIGNEQPISWGSFYKTQDLAGRIDRQVLIGAGTTIQKVNSDGTLTELLTGEPNNLFRTSDQLDRFQFITSADPFSVGRRGQMSKYDGTKITKWGLTAPGEQESLFPSGGGDPTEAVIENFDDSSIFTGTGATVADSTDIAFKGSTATAMTKTSGSTSASIEDLNRTAFAVNNIIADRVRMQVYIPREDYRKLATSGRALSVYFGSSSTLASNYFRYDFQIGLLVEGWNTLIFDFSVFPSGNFGTTVGSPNDQDLKSLRFECITNNTTDTLTLYWDNLVSLDQGAPIPAFESTSEQPSSSGVFPAGSQWQYAVTFVDDVGNESNRGPASVVLDNDGATGFNQVNLTEVPTSFNPAVVARNLYRALANGTEFLFLGTINDNVTTTFTDTTADTSLGTSTPPELAQAITDNSTPPSAGIVTIWKRTAFLAGDPLNPTILVFSRFDLPEAFPILNAIEFDERITGLFKTYLGVVVTTETGYWRIIGDNPDYTVDKVITGFGGVGMRGVGTAREMGWATDRDGLRLYDLRETIKISEVIRNRVDAFNKLDLQDTHTAHSRKHNGLFWLTKDGNDVYKDIYLYQYMIDDMRRGWFTQLVPNPDTFNILHVWEIEDANGDFHLYCGTDKGMVFELFADDALNWVNETGQSRAITMELQTPFIRAGATEEARALQGTSGRVTPRLIELRVKEANGAAHTWQITVDTSDSASENASLRDTQTLTFNFAAGQSLLRLPTQDLTPGEYMRIKLVNSEKDKDLQIMGLKIFYHTRPSQYTVVSGTAGGQN
jgi:hypothetical protein